MKNSYMKKENTFIKNIKEYPKSHVLFLALAGEVSFHLVKYFHLVKPEEEFSLKDWTITILTGVLIGLIPSLYYLFRTHKVNKKKG